MKTRESKEFDRYRHEYKRHFGENYGICFGDPRSTKEHIAAIIQAIETNTPVKMEDCSNLPPGVSI